MFLNNCDGLLEYPLRLLPALLSLNRRLKLGGICYEGQRNPPTHPCSDSLPFLPCGSSFGAAEQPACGSLTEKRLSHRCNSPVPRSSSQHSPKRHNTDRTRRWPREYQRAALTLENGYYGRVASDDLLNHAIPTLRKRICSPAADKINISCF